MAYAFLCDFDGTASPTDIGAEFVRAFATGDGAEHRVLLERWLGGMMGHRELTEGECARVRVSRPEALGFARGYALDPHFAPFVRAARDAGHAVMVVSEGFDFYIEALLEREGLGDLPRASNRLRFEGDRVIPEFPDLPDGCAGCGTCKAHHVAHWRARGFVTVLVGDGMSDRCGARAADLVIARGDLLAWCGRERIEAIEFDTFEDVAAAAERLPGGAAWARPAG